MGVILTFLLINFQLAYYFLHTRIPEFRLLFFRFLFGIVILFQVNFVNSVLSLKIFFILFVSVYLFLLLFIRKVLEDTFSSVLLIVYSFLLLTTLFLEPVPRGASLIRLPLEGVQFISFSEVIGFSFGGVILFTSEHPWPYVLFRVIVNFYILLRILALDALDSKSKGSWLIYIGLHALFDLLFLFPLDTIRLAILWVANSYFFWVVWKRPHFLVLTNPQLVTLYGLVASTDIQKKSGAPFTNSQEIVDYISHVGYLMDNEG